MLPQRSKHPREMVITPKASTSTLLKRIAKRESNPCHLSSQANRARELLRRCGTGLATNPSVTLQPLCVYSNGLLAMHLPPKPSDVVALGTPARCHTDLYTSLLYVYYRKLIYVHMYKVYKCTRTVCSRCTCRRSQATSSR